MKAQAIRLIDVFALGPFMIWAGTQLPKKHNVAGNVMIAAGVATILYNWKNFKAIRDQETVTLGDVRPVHRPDYVPHLHTDQCPGGFPVEATRCDQ